LLGVPLLLPPVFIRVPFHGVKFCHALTNHSLKVILRLYGVTYSVPIPYRVQVTADKG
jgi:hypothetical protein